MRWVSFFIKYYGAAFHPTEFLASFFPSLFEVAVGGLQELGGWDQAEGAGFSFPLSPSHGGMWKQNSGLGGEANPAALIGRERRGALLHADRQAEDGIKWQSRDFIQ